MIRFLFYRNHCGRYTGFECKNHGADIVCAAVSILCQNTVNSVEAFTQCDFRLDYDENQTGYMEFLITGEMDDKAELLMNSLHLGIQAIGQEYDREIEVLVKEV